MINSEKKIHPEEDPGMVMVGDGEYVPHSYIDDDGDALEYDEKSSSWIARNEQGDIVKIVRC